VKVIRASGPDDTKIMEEAVPEPRPFDVLSRIEAVGVCHTDLEIKPANGDRYG